MNKPDQCSLNDLHASLIKLINLYLKKPNDIKVASIVRLLNAILEHSARDNNFIETPYREALLIWSSLAVSERSENLTNNDMMNNQRILH